MGHPYYSVSSVMKFYQKGWQKNGRQKKGRQKLFSFLAKKINVHKVGQRKLLNLESRHKTIPYRADKNWT